MDRTKKEYYTDAYFHTTGQLEEEVRQAGFLVKARIGIEGFFWFMEGRDALLADEERTCHLLAHLNQVELDRSL
ncbi:MAG: hypothetical protein KDC10_06910 [Calditrichaeota bacterium]|nr:hypothetical protein [Calditrichota bacterium]